MHPATPSERPAPNWPPREVGTICETFLAYADEAAPGLVEGLYLHGSLGFGEWIAGRSDIDYVAVLAARPDRATTALLRTVHERLAGTFPTTSYDGFHPTWHDLAQAPSACPDVPCTQGGEWKDEGRFDVSPVTWHELARHGVVIRGPRLEDVKIWTDQQALRAHTHENLESYWAEQARALRRFPDEAARPDLVGWAVLGIPRLHHLLATDRLTSKSAAGRYAVDAFGEQWRPLVNEALAYRSSGQLAGELTTAELSEQVVEFVDLVLARGLAIRP